MSDTQNQPDLVALSADIVSAYVIKNAVRSSELSGLIDTVHRALGNLGKPVVVTPDKPTPAVNPKRSVTPDHLISLEDGRRYKTLTRHLRGLGMTPDQYRAKWGLGPDYPMTAPSYSARRSELARSLGLGQARRKAVPVAESATTEEARSEPAAEASAPKRSRARKAGTSPA
jgi:predicted transcriptional regulator